MKKGKNISPAEEKLTEPSPDSIDIEASSPELEFRKRKTSQNLHHYGSFFLRVGAIGNYIEILFHPRNFISYEVWRSWLIEMGM